VEKFATKIFGKVQNTMTKNTFRAAFVIGTLLISMAFSRTSGIDPPAFDAASVRLSAADERAAAAEFLPGGRFRSNIALRYVIERAYDIEDYQLQGDPAWVKTERYAIEAKTDSPATDDQLRLMVQAMLASRFGLKIRRETRDLPVYALVVGKNGPKLTAAADATQCEGHGCFGIGKGSFSAKGATMPWTAKVLNRIMDRPVLDKTQLSGNYDFVLHFDPSTASSPMMAAVTTEDSSQGSIFTVIQEQIGLKLDPRKEPVEVLVIDHVERPSGN
jgi:uncharacterized protein (TIGR03435 family)